MGHEQVATAGPDAGALASLVKLDLALEPGDKNVRGEGDSPIFLTGHRKIGTVPDVLSPGS